MKKILILSDSFCGYGAEHILRWLGNMLCSRGYFVTFCSIFDTEKNPELTEKASYYQMGFRWWKYGFHYFVKGAMCLRKYYKNEKFDYVITFHTNPFMMALLARLMCDFKLLHSERDNPYNRDTLATKLKMWLYRFADIIVFQTTGAKAFFSNKVQSKSSVIPNPVAIPDYKWQGFGKKTLVNVGRLNVRFKRQDLLLQAFSKITNDYPDYIMKFYGDGKDLAFLQGLAKELGISDKVMFLGKVNDVNDHLKNEEIFILSSDSEGMPNALMEAMALGMPVISTDCEPGGARALIMNGKDGLLVERSSVGGLVDAMKKLFNKEVEQKEMGAAARNKMKLFIPERVFQQWEDILI